MRDPVKSCLTLLRLIFLALVIIITLMASSKGEHSHEHQKGHQLHHAEFYSKWKTETGGSCCNDADCAPIASSRVRTRGESVEVFIENEWLAVPQEKIRPYMAPDMNSHLCHVGKHIYCFVFGGGV